MNSITWDVISFERPSPWFTAMRAVSSARCSNRRVPENLLSLMHDFRDGSATAALTSGYSDLRTDPRPIFGLRKPIAIHAEISLNMNLPE
jgi:hypothetical protein